MSFLSPFTSPSLSRTSCWVLRSIFIYSPTVHIKRFASQQPWRAITTERVATSFFSLPSPNIYFSSLYVWKEPFCICAGMNFSFLITFCCLIVSATLCVYNPTHSWALDCFKMVWLLMGEGVYRGAVMTLRFKPYGYKKNPIHGAALWRHHVKVVETYSNTIPLNPVVCCDRWSCDSKSFASCQRYN